MKFHATRETCLAMEILSTFHTHILSVFAGNKQPSFAIVRILETKITLKNKVCLGLACALSYFFLQFLGQSDVIVAISGVVGFLFYNILPSSAFLTYRSPTYSSRHATHAIAAFAHRRP
jgi:hypothetical protein